jgi:hypothetical protein
MGQAALKLAHRTVAEVDARKCLRAETVDLPLIQNTYPRAHKAARSNGESVAALYP